VLDEDANLGGHPAARGPDGKDRHGSFKRSEKTYNRAFSEFCGEDRMHAREAIGEILYTHAEVVGFGISSDAHHLTHLSIDGPVRAMRAALLDARLRPEQVGYVNAHGSGTLINDPLETQGEP
jgi:hypothetical protein